MRSSLQTLGRLAALGLILFTLVLPTNAHPAPASDTAGTLLSWDGGQIRLQGADGRAFQVKTTPATWILRRGLPSEGRDFAPGETLQIRLGRGLGGTTRALLVCDPETAEALGAERGHLLLGTLLKADGKLWIVQPTDNPLPLPVCLSSRTQFRAGQMAVTSAAFGVGAAVTVKTHGLPNGLLTAETVSDGADTIIAKETSKTRKSFTGIVLEVRPDLSLLTLQDKNGLSHTITITTETVIKVRTRKNFRTGSWADLAAGVRVTAHFAGTSDTGGSPAASSLSVTPLQ